MKTLIHYKKQRLEEFINRLSLLHGLYIERSFSFDTELSTFVKDSIDFFEQLGESSKALELSQLNIYVETAKKGINPQTLEKLKTGKRENIWIASYYLLDKTSSLFQNAIIETDLTINQAKELIEQVILSALQSKLINNNTLKELHKQEEIDTLWRDLSQNEQVEIIDKKLKLSVTHEDIIILCDQICSKIRS